MKFGICNEIFENWKLEEVFACAANLGFHGVELAPFTIAESAFDISKAQRDKIRLDAEKAKVEVVGLHWLLVSPKGLHLNHPDSSIRQKTKEYFLELVKLCGDLGGKVMVIGSPTARQVLPEISYEQAWEYAKQTFIEAAKLAAERDVILCMEPLFSESTNFINTPKDAVKMIEAVNHPNFRLILDVRSTSAEKIDMAESIRKYGKYLSHFHANDDNGYYPGSGGVDYPPIFEALREINFSGYASVEVFDFKPDPVTIATESIKFLRDLIK